MRFSQLSEYFQKIESVSSRISMTEILADLFRTVTAEESGMICYLLQGRVAPLFEPIEFGIADKFMIRALAQAYGVEAAMVEKEFRTDGDLGITSQKLHTGKDKGYSVKEVFDLLCTLTQTSGSGSQEDKIAQVSKLLATVDALSARYITRIPLGKLRLGFSDMTILDGLSWMQTGNKSLHDGLEAAYSVRPDIGWIATTFKEKGMSGFAKTSAKFGVPILASLCQRLPTADEMIEKMGEVVVEPKYDGVRAQIHFKRQKGNGKDVDVIVKTYSRNLESTTDMFPELLEVGKQLDADEVILDAEAVGVDAESGKILPFQETTTRKRKHNIQEALVSVPLRFYVFDMIYKNGQDLLATPLLERRKLLEQTIKSGNLLTISPQITTQDADMIRTYHAQQIATGLEGVIIKRANSPYEPGRRGFSWVKFKEEEGKTGKLADTVDAVIMGYYRGEGKRSGFGIGALLVGIKKGESFVTVTKIGTGVTDDMWKDFKVQLTHITAKEQPKGYIDVAKTLVPDTWVYPEIVVEIAGDDLTKSPSHGAGYAIRFPRLVKIRTDKNASQCTAVDELKQMYTNQFSSK